MGAASLAGCLHSQLLEHTLKTAETLSDLQFQLVLDNLAMFPVHPIGLPWHMKLWGGTVQVNDRAGADLTLGVRGTTFQPEPSATGWRQVTVE